MPYVTALWVFWFFTFLSFLFFYSRIHAQPKRLSRFWWLMAQTTRFHPRTCLLGVWFLLGHIGGSLSPKNRPKKVAKWAFQAKNTSIDAYPKRLNRFWRLMAQTMRFQLRTSLLRVIFAQDHSYGLLFPKTAPKSFQMGFSRQNNVIAKSPSFLTAKSYHSQILQEYM